LEWVVHLDEVNESILSALVNDVQEARQVFEWFERESSIRDTQSERFQVQEYLRSRILDYLRLRNPDRCADLSERCHSVSSALRAKKRA
jgi:hypothetical protein